MRGRICGRYDANAATFASAQPVLTTPNVSDPSADGPENRETAMQETAAPATAPETRNQRPESSRADIAWKIGDSGEQNQRSMP